MTHQGDMTHRPQPPDHGPVRVHGTRFRHADGTPFHPWTTSVPQADDDTLRALAGSPFTKVRLLSATLPLDRLDHQVRALGAMGVQAEVVLHGRDIPETVTRLAGHSNVWWCAPPDPEAQTDIQEHDHGHHPLTVHGPPDTDFGAPWITHASVRHPQTRAVSGLVQDLCKPVLVDDCGAEGDDPADPEHALPGAELVSRIWEAVCRGGYAAHAESWGTRPWSAGAGAWTAPRSSVSPSCVRCWTRPRPASRTPLGRTTPRRWRHPATSCSTWARTATPGVPSTCPKGPGGWRSSTPGT